MAHGHWFRGSAEHLPVQARPVAPLLVREFGVVVPGHKRESLQKCPDAVRIALQPLLSVVDERKDEVEVGENSV